MYMAMVFTSWNFTGAQKVYLLNSFAVLKLNNRSLQFDVGPVSLWVKMASQWLAILLYLWSLVGPVVLPDRDWS